MATGHYRYACEPAATVIRALGGVRALAGLLDLSPESVSQWNRPARKGGFGGYVPVKYHAAIFSEAKAMGARTVTLKLLKSGRMEKLDMGAASKRKGDRFEFQVVRELVEAGFPGAHRVPLSGAVKGYPGDVLVKGSPTGDWIIQCKVNQKATGGGRGGVARFLAQANLGRLTTKSGKVFMAMRGEVLIELMKGKKPLVANMPETSTSGSSIEGDIEGHDALVFRWDGARSWNAIVTLKKWESVK